LHAVRRTSRQRARREAVKCEHAVREGVRHGQDDCGAGGDADERTGDLELPPDLRECRHRRAGRVAAVRVPDPDARVEAKPEHTVPQGPGGAEIVIVLYLLNPAGPNSKQ